MRAKAWRGALTRRRKSGARWNGMRAVCCDRVCGGSAAWSHADTVFRARPSCPAARSTIFVDMFENRTNQAGLETTVTNAVVFEFTKRSETAIVARRRVRPISS
ncbi:MAG: hypothetical protein MZV70_08480 [Desulfobacterales bacterium]|nr:hypothetical protein [Desulfobacterales bacterium]